MPLLLKLFNLTVKKAVLAQSVERWTANPTVKGSSPLRGVNFAYAGIYVSWRTNNLWTNLKYSCTRMCWKHKWNKVCNLRKRKIGVIRKFRTRGFRTISPKWANSINEKLALKGKKVYWNRDSREVLWAMVLYLWLTPIASHWHTFYGTRTTFAGSLTFCRWSNFLKQIPRGLSTCEITASGINYSIRIRRGLRSNLSFKRGKFRETILKDANSIIWKKSLKKKVVYWSKIFNQLWIMVIYLERAL